MPNFLEPMEDWMILELVEEKKPISLLMPEGHEKEKDENAIFRVKAVGRGYYQDGLLIEHDIVPGDVVVVTNYGMSKFMYKGEKILLSRVRDVVLRVNEEQK